MPYKVKYLEYKSNIKRSAGYPVILKYKTELEIYYVEVNQNSFYI